MSHPIALEQKQKQTASLKQMQRLIMSPQMQQALHLLQLPVLELSTLIENELEQNPVLDNSEQEGIQVESNESEEENQAEEEEVLEKSLNFDERDLDVLKRLDEDFRDLFNDNQPFRGGIQEEKLRTFLESNICGQESLFEHLMKQAQETFSDPKELRISEAIIGNLDAKGFLTITTTEVAELNGISPEEVEKVLAQIQTFDPYGVGAKNLQQALLIQLRNQGKVETLAYRMVEGHFQDLIRNHLPLVKRALHCSLEEIQTAIQEDISKLDLHPGSSYSRDPVQTIVPDVSVTLEGEELKVIVNDEPLPSFHINRKYMRMLQDENVKAEEKEFIRNKLLSAKWLMRNLYQRSDTLERIAQALAKRQKQFFMQNDGKLEPLTMKILADELEIHESTIARAVANKYIDSPRGLLPLRSFFTNAYETAAGEEISSSTVRDVLQEIIRTENKSKPFSDEVIAKMIKEKGIDCARRTVAKYRAALQIGNAHQRRQW